MGYDIGPYTTAPGRRFRWQNLVVWSEDGCVWYEDQDDGTVTVHSCLEASGRLRAFTEELGVWDKQKIDPDQKTRVYAMHMFDEIKKMCEILDEVIRDAKDQGDQHDPVVRQRLLREFLRRKQAGGGNHLLSVDKQMEGLFGTAKEELARQLAQRKPRHTIVDEYGRPLGRDH